MVKAFRCTCGKRCFRPEIKSRKYWNGRSGCKSADDVELGDRFAVSGSRGFESFFERHGVRAGRVFLAAKGAEPASRNANICGINVAIDVEVRLVAMHALAHVIRQPADRENVAGAIKRKRVVGSETLASHNFRMDEI